MPPEEKNPLALEQESREKRPSVEEIACEAGINLNEIDPEVVARLVLLHEKSPTLLDEYRALLMAKKLFAHCAETDPAHAYSESEQKTVRVGTIFTDIGKTGPKHARRAAQDCITEMFGIDEHVDPKTPVLEFLKTHFPLDYPGRLILLDEAGVKPDQTMRQFWNMHSAWTLEIIHESGIPPEAIPAAALHHRVEGMNPQGIVGNDERFTRYFGENVAFDRAEKMVIMLDKYDAARRRGSMNHEEAVAYLRKHIGNHGSYDDDPEFHRLINDIETVLKDHPGYAN
jgi:hypothetical protein